MKLSPSNIIKAIDKLPKNQIYEYPNKKTKTRIQIYSVQSPIGPVKIKRYTIDKGGNEKCTVESISKNMIQRYSNAFEEGIPVNIDRVLGASYSTRSSLEALLAATPEFYLCYPKRIQMSDSSTDFVCGHKHLMWKPHEKHKNGIICNTDCDLTISERPSIETIYGVIEIPEGHRVEVSIDHVRRHTQMQILLAQIGNHLGFKTHIAINDQSIVYNKKPLLALPSVVPDLNNIDQTKAYPLAIKIGRLIDCIWFQNCTLMPAVIEVEHSTGVTSGLVRMKSFRDKLARIETRYVIVAPDEDRDLVLDKCRESQFTVLKPQYFPYSAVEELFSICEKRKIGNSITDEFLDCFMESTKAA